MTIDRIPVADRLLQNMRIVGECWIWQGSTNHGYGIIGITVEVNKTKTFRTHRISYELHKGEITAGMDVLHTCDNPACINPEHLFLGTQQQNADDMKRKGRSLIGERNSHSQLTSTTVRRIRRAFASGHNYRSLTRYFDTSYNNIVNIVNRTRWKHIE